MVRGGRVQNAGGIPSESFPCLDYGVTPGLRNPNLLPTGNPNVIPKRSCFAYRCILASAGRRDVGPG